MHWLLPLVCFVALAATPLTTGAKLNYPRVLLPVFQKLSIDFTLEVIEGGCFKWTVSRADLILIKPVTDPASPNECSSRAVVTSIGREFRRSTAIVLVEDLLTGEVLRCDVILDVIHELGVLTTTRELYLEEAPETFELRAVDAQGNAFSTLEGVQFDWQIAAQHSNSAVLKFLRFAESPYHEVPRSVATFDASSDGGRGHMVLLEGINTGSAKVIAKLPQSEYGQVAAVEVDIMVLANIIIDPSDAHILVGDKIAFRILQLKQGKLHEITSNTQYYLEVEDKNLASIEGNYATGSRLGRTSVILRDRNVLNDATSPSTIPDSPKTTPSPRAFLTITTAAKITLSLLPHNNWLTILNERHDIAVDLYSSDNNHILLGDSYKIATKFDENIFYPIDRTRNGSRIHGEAAQSGSSHVEASFEGLQANADLIVFDGIDLKPTRVVLPLDPNNPRRQYVQFNATGYDNSFLWSSNKAKHVYLSPNGLADVRLDLLSDDLHLHTATGAALTHYAQVSVALARNPKITRTADLIFVPPHQLQIVRYNFETSLGDYVDLHVAIYSSKINGQHLAFTRCDNLHLELEFTNPIFHNTDEPAQSAYLSDDACRVFRLKATSLGQTQLRVSYTFGDRLLKDEVSLVVFEPLNILNPLANEVVLPIGSSRNLIYQHGPQKLFSVEAELVEEQFVDATIATVSRLPQSSSHKDKQSFTVLCRRVGETELVLRLHNQLATANFAAYISEFRTHIHCVKPRFVNLFTTQPLRSSCPLKLKNSMMHVRRTIDSSDAQSQQQPLEVGVEVLDASNRRLQNVSSLLLDWEFTQLLADSDQSEQRRAPLITVAHRLVAEEELVAGVAVPLRDVLHSEVPDVKSNSYKIKATVQSYDAAKLKSLRIQPERPEFGVQKTTSEDLVKPIIENELSFLAVNSTLLPFDSISIYLSRNRQERVPLAQGSGYYDIKLSEAGIIKADLDAATNELVITPLRFGHVSVELSDKCLMEEPSVLLVSVVSIGRIEVQMPDRVEKTKSIEAIVRLYDSQDNPMMLDRRDLGAYDLRQEVINPEVTAVKLDANQQEMGVGEIRYKVTGLELGETKILYFAGIGEQLVRSPAASIQVFPPLRLLPRNASIVVGSNVQIHSRGGPKPYVNVVYTVGDETVVSIDSAIATALRLGTSTITGRCVGISPSTGRQIVFSQDAVQLHVVPLTQIKIVTPLLRIRSGAVMPATLWGEPDISPMILGTLPDLSVVWSTDQPDVIGVFGVFADAGIVYGARDAISVRVKALNPGKAKLMATVVTNLGKQRIFVDVVVFKMLELESPKRLVADTVLIPPNFTGNLKTNLADTEYYVEAKDSGSVVTVTRDGTLRSGETIGRDVVIATTTDQSLSIPIEVKNVQYLLTTLHTASAKLKHSEAHIPRGVQLSLRVTLHDNLGNEFWHQQLDDVQTLSTRLTRREMADIHVGDNFTIGINFPRHANGMLAVSLKQPHGVKYAEDFVKLSVAESVLNFPAQSTVLGVGDIVCFESALAYATHWHSSDDAVISVDGNLGVGRVLANRNQFADKVTVTSGASPSGLVKFDVEVRAADQIIFFPTPGVLNGFSVFAAPLIIRSQLQPEKQSNLIARNRTTCAAIVTDTISLTSLFNCQLRSASSNDGVQQSAAKAFLAAFEAVSVFDIKTGLYACQVQLRAGHALFSVDRELLLELSVHLSSGVSDSTPLRVTPSIQVHPIQLSLDQLPIQILTVKGVSSVLTDVQVTSSDPTLIEVVAVAKSADQWQFRARLISAYNPLDSSAVPLAVIVSSPRSQQSIRVPIQTAADIAGAAAAFGGQCSSQPLWNVSNALVTIASNVGLIISVIVALAVIVWTLVYLLPPKSVGDNRPTEELLIDLRMMGNDLRRRIRKCETEESAQLTRLRESTREGRSHISPVHAENVIRQRTELVRLETTLGQLVGLADRLKKAIMNASVSDGSGQIEAALLADRQLAIRVLQEARSATADQAPVPRTEIDTLISRLTETSEDGLASIASMQQDELMNRLRSLRK